MKVYIIGLGKGCVGALKDRLTSELPAIPDDVPYVEYTEGLAAPSDETVELPATLLTKDCVNTSASRAVWNEDAIGALALERFLKYREYDFQTVTFERPSQHVVRAFCLKHGLPICKALSIERFEAPEGMCPRFCDIMSVPQGFVYLERLEWRYNVIRILQDHRVWMTLTGAKGS